MKRLAMILAVTFTMGLASSSVFATGKDNTKKAETTATCTAKDKKACTATDKKACCASADKKACCNKDAKVAPAADTKTK